MKKIILAFLLIIIPRSVLAVETLTTVAVTSATAGVQVVASIGGGVCITVPTSATVPVYVARISGSCASVLTTQAGIRIPVPGATSIWSTQCFVPKQDGYSGQLCAILESSGSTTVNVSTW